MRGPREIVPMPPGCPWGGWSPPDIQHCEENLCAWIAAPSDTWSNLAYAAAAWWLWRRYRRDPELAVRLFAPVTLVAGAASFVFHASFSFLFQFGDYVGMFLLVLLLLSLNLRRLGLRSWRLCYAAGVPASCLALLAMRSAGVGVQWLIVVQAAAVLGAEAWLALRSRSRADHGPLALGAGLLGAGTVFWLLDYTRVLCDPADHVFQGHAVWHLLSAASIMPIAAFYRRALRDARS